MYWDIFCKVIDNHGDIGVCWRVASGLAERGEAVRLWVDDASALAWMAPDGHPRVQVLPWAECRTARPGDVVVEAFACELEPAFVAAIAERTRATGRQPAWINLEYLSAEAWVERCHGLPSPVLSGPGRGLTKHFFHPGFSAATGGLVREPDLPERQAAFDRQAWLRARGIDWRGERLLSLFCYEPPGLHALLDALARSAQPTRLLVTAGRADAAVRQWLAGHSRVGSLVLDGLPLMPQSSFDELLWACDLNLVRGEDSLVRALWAGQPLVWNIYPQHDDAHLAKLDAFLDWLGAPPSLRAFHAGWNRPQQPLPAIDIDGWRPAVQQARRRLLALPDLVSELMRFAVRG
ncbi:elongation factor P maturation arginine rhamnosyltransferase EarP [Ramlibacter tataouinensis]|uniref:elongation factor P maturation arginine rhamnosyltransferase EarP n=1 Tax=Ramlibacter tataouinensis TaxID=94132 RepID=UPI0022F3C7D0|nr:elongation factor P maturation arginine rhamnosyltransferase EarP [Ramlibacter tataouinensis]WBY01652.1 elongation factor P maturation arginine rhamnosyltransferase EarP [Ramlibacter tataouinensis]